MNPEQAYDEMIALSREETLLASCLDLLEWDEEVSMPRNGVEHRAEQRALLAGLVHDRETNPRYEELLVAVEGSPLVSDRDSAAAVNVREIRRSFDKERRMPRRLVEEWARVTAMAQQRWSESRRTDDYASFAPWLERIFTLARERADAVGYEGTPYDALLDDYEPGMTTDRLTAVLTDLRTRLVPLVAAMRDARPAADDLLERDFPIERQKQFAESAAAVLGFHLQGGRLDVGQHPFCSMIGPGDVRVALRYHPRDFTQGFYALLHELGHAFYDQGLDTRHYGTPMGEAASLGVHESQSRLWENHVGRSEGFWRHFYPKLCDAFPDALHDVSIDAFRGAVNRVAPGPIRIHADEVTYDLHIAIRFELELALLSGDLRAADLPGAWNELYVRHLGVRPANDREGCLQDIHWSEGLIGYFPTYSLGNVYAAQLFAAAERAVGPLEDAFARGQFAPLRGWLTEHVHRHGMRWPVAELVERATGKGPDAADLVESLTRRYRPTSS
ncbi:MAG TPA: carboxypeptidase M32 [Gemmatimonadaceae bacterium]|nr:carboxypeptidase M32 [Gemmatimonadaceae bacterium]